MEQTKLDAIKQIFDADEVSAEPNDKGGWDITVASMYESPTYQGTGGLLGLLTAIQAATGCTNVDIIDEFSRSGCESCDYGSSYGKIYRVW